eukprot:7679276-Pyramimonas_sp.AAC.1
MESCEGCNAGPSGIRAGATCRAVPTATGPWTPPWSVRRASARVRLLRLHDGWNYVGDSGADE